MRRITRNLTASALVMATFASALPASGSSPTRIPLQKKSPVAALLRSPLAHAGKRPALRRTPPFSAPAPRKFMASEVSYYESLCEVTLSSPIGYANVKSEISATGGGALAGDTYYAVETVAGSIFSLSAYDASTWEQKSSVIVYGYDYYSHDMTYDPVDGKIYGCFMKTNADGEVDGFTWGWLDVENERRVALGDMEFSLAAVAADGKGAIYGLDYEGVLYSIDKSTGALTRIAETGLKSELGTGGVIDPKTGLMYYVTQTNADMPMIYSVNVTDGETAEIGALDEYQQLRGMFFPAPAASDNAPAAVESIDLQFSWSALMGMVVFTLPSTTYAGDELTGQLEYTITVNGEDRVTNSGTAGGMVYEFMEFPAPGLYTVGVKVSNESGASPVTEATRWIGTDELTPLRRVNMTEADGEVTLSWDAPAPAHDGFIDEDLLKYDVVRLPEGKAVATDISATTCTDRVEKSDLLKTTSWRVDVKYDGAVVSSATSATLVTGSEAEVPFRTSFETEADFSMFSVIDANADGMKWQWMNFYDVNQCAGLKSHETNAGDDYLVTPGIRMKGGRSYRVAFVPSCYMPWCPERMEVLWGTAPEAGALSNLLVEPMTVDKTKAEAVKVTAMFTPETDGLYYFAFHGVSDPYEFYLMVDDIAITESTGKAPAMVDDLSVTADATGASKVHIAFTAPSVDENGDRLASLNTVTLSRDGRVIKTWEAPAPGTPLAYDDEDEDLAGTSHSYVCVAANDDDEGAPASAVVYVGEDSPWKVDNVKAVESSDGTVTVTWDAPASGEHGGFINPSNLTYTVARHHADTGTVETLGTTQHTSFTDEYNPATQTVVSYLVRPANEIGMGTWADSETLVMGGTPDAWPFAESVAGGNTSHTLWGSENFRSKGSWYIATEGVAPACAPQDGDGGMFEFVQEAKGDRSRLASGKIDASVASHPVLTFWYYAAGSNRLTVQVNADNSGWTDVLSIDLAEATASGWQKARVDLAGIGARRSLRLGFVGEAVETSTGIYIDNILLTDAHGRNLSVVAASWPDEAVAGIPAGISATVRNNGLQPVENATLGLLRDGALVESLPIPALAPGEETVLETEILADPTLPASVLYAVEIDCPDDGDLSDNSAMKRVDIVLNHDFPAPAGFSGAKDDSGNVTLSWNAPAAYSGTLESWEQYAPFGFSSRIGGWKSIDGSGKGKIVPVDGESLVDFPTAGLAVGFQVFDAREAGMQSHDLDGIDGSRAIVAFADKEGTNSDWLISPQVKGGQEISFHVKAGSRYFKEKYEVLYSSTDSDPESFSPIGETRTASAEWGEVKVTLPADVRYFAIRYCSHDCYALLVDDLSYLSTAASAKLTGYNVYRDGMCIDRVPVSSTTYSCALTDARQEFALSALYDLGESCLTAPLAFESTGIEAAGSETGVTVSASAGRICIAGAAGRRADIYTPDGIRVFSRECGERETVALPAGIYVVRIAGRSWKVRL